MNTAADDEKSITAFKNFFYANFGKEGYDILISPIRDDFNKPNSGCPNLFLKEIHINDTDAFILEIPFGKVTVKGKRPTALEWYKTTMDNLIYHTLTNTPFNI